MLRKFFSELTTISLTAFTAITSLGSMFTYVFGAWNKTFQIMLILIVWDIITGIIIACKGKSSKSENGKLSSKAGERGVMKKVGLITGVGLANLVGMLFPPETQTALREGVVIAIIWNEAVSIMENHDVLGWWVPGFFKQFILANKKKAEEASEQLTQSTTESPHEEPYNEKESEETSE